MIQKTDLLILVIATAGLSVGIYRWHENTQNISAVTIPASSTVVIPAPEMPPESSNMSVNSMTASTNETETLVAEKIEETHSIEPAQDEFLQYVVRSGDSLSRIAVRHNTDVSTLQRLNQIDGTEIYAGQTLVYPVSAN